jgi:hypothetical protein
MSNKEKAELYVRLLKAFTPVPNHPHLFRFYGLCRWFEALYCKGYRGSSDINRFEYALLKKDLDEYRKANKHRKKDFFWEKLQYAPRLQYLENRLYHYQKLVENEG